MNEPTNHNLSTVDTMNLHQQGVEVWNSFMDEKGPTNVSFSSPLSLCDFKGYKFSGYANFSDISFEEMADFREVEFYDTADFHNAKFEEAVFFQHAVFHQQAIFSDSIFKSVTDFSSAKFQNRADFNDIKFLGRTMFEWVTFYQEAFFDEVSFNQWISFSYSSFKKVAFFSHSKFNTTAFFTSATIFDAYFNSCDFIEQPVFFGTNFKKVPNFLGAKISSDFIFGMNLRYRVSSTKKWWEVNKADERIDGLDYRVLKQHAIAAKDHELELQLFAWEMMAKRWYYIKNPLSIMLSFLYQWFSSFGYSIARPVLSLILLCNLCSYSYYNISVSKNYLNSVVYSLSNILPFGILGKSSTEYHKSLFSSTLPWSGDFELQFYVTLISNIIFGFSFLFLIGLGLKNRFKL